MKKQRNSMSYDSTEMAIKGFAGVGTVVRENGENFVVFGRDAAALRLFWKRWLPDFKPDPSKNKKCVVITSRHLK